MDLGLKGKYVVVTGGANGIGKATVCHLLREKSIPIVIDKDKSALDNMPRGIIAHECDVSDSKAFHETLLDIKQQFPVIYALVNNAGVNDGVAVSDGLPSFVNSLQRNLFHYYQLVSELYESIKISGGSIVNVSSKVSLTGQGRTSGYAASKGAINALTREWAVDFAKDGVRVNAVIPAEVETPQYARWISDETNQSQFLSIKRKINLGSRLTTSEEIAQTILFLLSERSSHTTGQLIVVDGGYTHLDDSRNE